MTVVDTSASLTFRAMGTEWWVGCDHPELLAGMEQMVRDVEARLSRFRMDSALSRLNRERQATDPILAHVAEAAWRMRTLTSRAFDPTLGSQVARLGYDRDFDDIFESADPEPTPEDAWLDIRIDAETVRLAGSGELDLGGIAKGWTADLVHDELLSRGASRVLVDGGGDLRASGRWRVGVGQDRAVDLDGGLAASSTLRRTWRRNGRTLHHLVDAGTGRPSTSAVVEATVLARDAATADALATAMVVAPERVMGCLGAIRASAWLSDAEGNEWTTPDWKEIR